MANRDFSGVPYFFVGAVVAIQEEIEKAAERLVDKGKSLTPEGRKKAMSVKKGLVSKGDDFSQVVGRTVQRGLENSGIVTRTDLESLNRRVSEIEKKVSSTRKAKKAAMRPVAKAKKAKASKAKKAKKAKKARKVAKKPAAKAKKAARKPAAKAK